MTDEELNDQFSRLAKLQEQAAIDTANMKQDTKELQKQVAIAQAETDKQIKETNKQIGGLANKFGSFTEGLALPSMQAILQEKFNMEAVSPSVRVRKEGREIEVDVLAYANSTINEAYVVEVKSHLREEGIEQLSNTIDQFRFFFPEHKDKKLFGILAAVETPQRKCPWGMSDSLKQKVLDKGFYAAKISDEVFSLDVPVQFQPKEF